MRPILMGVLLACGLSQQAQAGLFSDDEARKAIIELRAKQQQSDEAQRARAEQTLNQLQEQIAPLRRSLLDLNAQLEALRAEIAKLRGQNEQLARDFSETQRKLNDQTQSLEARLRPLEPQKVTLDGREFKVEPAERDAYDAAMALVRKGEFDAAATALAQFLKRYGSSGYVDSARFWLGNAQYAERDYKAAIASFTALVKSNPEHPRAGDALLTLAASQIELKDSKSARRVLNDLIKAYPGTEAARAAKERLASLK